MPLANEPIIDLISRPKDGSLVTLNLAGAGGPTTAEPPAPVGQPAAPESFIPVSLDEAIKATSPAGPVPVPLDRAIEVSEAMKSPGYKLVNRSTVELANDPDFSPTGIATSFPEVLKDPDVVEKLALAHSMKKARGVDVGRLAWSAVEGAPAAFEELVVSLVKDLPKNLFIAADPRSSDEERRAATLKVQSGLEVAVNENVLIAGMSKQKVKEWFEIARALPGFSVPAGMVDAVNKIAGVGPDTQDPKTKFFDEVSQFENLQRITKGEGAISSKFVIPTSPLAAMQIAAGAVGRASAGEDLAVPELLGVQVEKDGKSPIEQLKERGVVVDQEFMDEVDRLSNVTDPLNILPGVGGAFSVVSKGGKVFAKVAGLRAAKQTAEQIGKVISARNVVGQTLRGAGAVTEAVGKQASKGVVGGGLAGGAVAGLVTGGISVPAAAAAFIGGPIAKKVGSWLKGVGLSVASDTPKGIAARTVAAAVDTTTGVVKGGLDGVVAVTPLLLLLDDQEMAEQLASYGIAGGVLGRGTAKATVAVKTAAQEATIKAAQEAFNTVDREPVASATYGTDPARDTKHQAAEQKVAQRDSKLANTMNFLRETVRPLGIELYYASNEDLRTELYGPKPAQGPDTRPLAAPQGWINKGNRILINAEGASVRTPYHEVAHALAATAKILAPDLFAKARDAVVVAYGSDKISALHNTYNALLFGVDPQTGQPKAEIGLGQFIEEELMAEGLANVLQGNKLSTKSGGFSNSLKTMAGRMAERMGLYTPKAVGGTVSAVPGIFGQAPSFTAQKAFGDLMATVFPEVKGPQPIQKPVGDVPVTPAPDVTPEAPPPSPETEISSVPISSVSPAAPVSPTVGVPPATEVRGGPKTAENLRLDLDQRKATSQPLDLYGSWREVDALLQNTPNLDPKIQQTWNQIFEERSKYADTDMPPLEILYRAVTPDQETGRPPGRQGRRADQAEAYIQEALGALPDETRTLFSKQSSLYNLVMRRNPDGSLNLNFWAFSPDKALGNAILSAKLMAQQGALDLLPYQVSYEGLTLDQIKTGQVWSPEMLSQLSTDLATYVGNQAKGFMGTGQKIDRNLARQAGYADYLPPERGTPVPLEKKKADYINMLMGLTPPLTTVTRGAQVRSVPANIMARIFAESQGRPVAESSLAAEGEFTSGKRKGAPKNVFRAADFPGILTRDVAIGEPNFLREELVDRGVSPDDIRNTLTEAIEEVSIEHIESVRPATESLVRGAPSVGAVRAGFQPAAPGVPGQVAVERAPFTPKRVDGHPAPTTIPPRPIGDDSAEIDLPVSGVDGRGNYFGEEDGLIPSRFQPAAPGDSVTPVSASYPEADKKAGDGNLWVRQTDAATNRDRVLVVQFTPDLMYPNGPDPVSTPYYDALYSGLRQGYDRAKDFWEIPQWQAVVTHALGERVDSYYVRNVEEAKRFMSTADYGHVAFSVMDVSSKLTQELAPSIGGKLHLGGYTDRSAIADAHPNAVVYDNMKSFVESFGIPYKKGFDYRLFRDTKTIPRLELSAGCRHRCTFCTIDRKVTESPMEEVGQQVDAFKDLDATLVYLNDKTFGQAANHVELPRIYRQMKEANPNFGGFVVQTTAAQMKLFTDEYLRDSGIRYIELGVETYNDTILKTLRKPANEKLIDEAVEKMRRNGIGFIPNIVIGFPGETAATYGRTKAWLEKNADIISHVNTYNLAIYQGTELSKEVEATTAADADENSPDKSFYKDPAVHRDFAKWIYEYGVQQLEKGGPDAVVSAREQGRAQPATPVLPEVVQRLVDAGPLTLDEGGRRTPLFRDGQEIGFEIQLTHPEPLGYVGRYGSGRAGERGVPFDRGRRPQRAEEVVGDFVREINQSGFYAKAVQDKQSRPGIAVKVFYEQHPEFRSERAEGRAQPASAEIDASVLDLPAADLYDVYKKHGGQTQASIRLAESGTVTEEQLKAKQAEVQTAAEEALAAWKANPSDQALMDAAMAAAMNGQFVRETLEYLTNTGGMAQLRQGSAQPSESPGAIVDRERVKLRRTPTGDLRAPKTDSGRASGLTFYLEDTLGMKRMQAYRGDQFAGEMFFWYDGSIQSSGVMNVWVHPDQRGQRIGETIYREVATILSENGIERVNGTVIDDVGRPFKIRERVFGNIEREGDFDVVSRIAPGQLFQPSNDPRALKLAAIRFPDGKVFTGPAHAFAWYAAEAEGYPSYNDILPESQIPEDGFVTNDGEFLNRNEAAERALELKQISEADAPRVLFPIGSAGEGLEAIRFQKYRQFQPAKPQTDFGEGIVAREGVRLATSRREASDGATLFSLSIIKPIDTLMAGEIGVPKPGWPAPEGFQWLSPETGGVVSKKGQLAEIGYIHYAVDSDWSDATVDGIRVAPMFQNRGFGEALYREAAAHLQSEGVRRVFGDIVDPAKRPQKLRERVFGDAPQTVRSQTTPGGILAVNRIDPLRRFLPSSDPRAIKTAAILLATGKIYEGMMHAFAFNEATEAGESLDNSITGFVTNDGEFLDRVQALQRAADLRQIPEDVLQNYTVGDVIGQEGEGGADYRGLDPTTPILESLQLDGTRRFMPVSFDDFAGDEKAVKAALNSDGWAIITATQEAIGDDQHPDNIAANAQLRSELLAVGADIIELEGFYKGLDQGTSYLVTGLSEDRIRAFGRKYNQESILTPTGLIFSDGTIVPARPSRNQVGEHAAKADFYSRLPSGISFSLGLDWSALQPETRTRRGIRRTLSVDKAPAIWILPNGQIVQATSLHERHLAENAGELNKRFGTDFSTVESVDERNKALRAGFVRVRYRPETGELVIELGPGTLRRQRAAIESLLLNNAEKADRVSISVLDTSGGKVRQVNYSDARLFDAEDPVAASIAALDELAESGRFQPAKPIALPDDPAEAARRLQKESSPETLNYYRVMVNIRPPATEKGLFGKAEGVVESKPEWVVAKNPTEARRVVRGRVLSREAEGYSVTLKEPELNSSFDFPYLTGRKVDGVPTVSARKFPDTLSPEKVASRYDDLFESVDKAVSFADKLPNLGYTPAEWNAAMAVALNGSKGYVPPAPLRLHEWMQDPQAFRDFLGQADRSIVDAAIGGLNGLKPVQERSKAGGIPVEMVALHFTWGILSRMLDPVNQEAGWIRLTSNPEFNRALADSIDGKFSMTKDQWKALVAESMSDTSVATGRAATANANVIHSMLTSWNGRWRELADVINSAELSGPEMRREFFRRGFAKGSGIQHKVLSFVLATLARSDMFILDRWQAVSMWFPSVKEAARRRAEQGTGSADPIVRLSDGTPEDTTGIYDILTKKGGLSDTTVAEAVYAMVERGLKLVLEANRDYLTELLGREPTVFDLHWLTWNVIKEEGVGHSSLDSTSQALDQGGIYGTEQFPERFADIPKRTEGRGTIRGRPVWQTFTGQRGSPANLEIRPLDRGAAERAGSLGEQAILSL